MIYSLAQYIVAQVGICTIDIFKILVYTVIVKDLTIWGNKMMGSLSIFTICAGTAVLVCIIVRVALAYVKANKEGILRVVPSNIVGIVISVAAVAFLAAAAVFFTYQSKPYKEFLDDLNARGTIPLAEYYGVAPEEFGSGIQEELRPLLLSNAKNFCKLAIEDYTRKRTLAVVFAIEFAAIAMTCGAFIAKNGKVYFMRNSLFEDMSCEFFACVKGKKIRFYDKDDSHKLPISLPATDENLMLCDDFIRPEILGSTEPAEG